MDKNYLERKWLKGELTDEEMEAYKKTPDYQLNKNIVEDIRHFKASHFYKVDDFEKLEHKLIGKESKVITLNWRTTLLKIASVIVILFGLYFLFLYGDIKRYETLAGEKLEVLLPDGSEVIINSESTLVFDDHTWDNDRKVNLQGEAFFKVAKGKKFIVHTDDGDVQVLGTKFNVKQRANFFEVECYEGIVRVSRDAVRQKLTAGGVLRIIDGTITSPDLQIEAPGWVTNKSLFNEVSLKEVLLELGRQYDIKFKAEAIDQTRLFSGGFTHSNLQDALQSITTPFNIEYRIKENNIIELKQK